MPNEPQIDDLNSADHYHYSLSKELIAQEPLANREDARLLTVDRATQTIDHHHVRDLDQILKPGDCLVLNDTKVIPAKLVGFRTKTRGRWQGLFLEADSNGNWRVLCKTRGKAKPGETISLEDRNGVERVTLDLVSRMEDGSWVVRPNIDGGTPEEILEIIGRLPIPNYIRGGSMVDADFKTYQTVFARTPGSLAAPTAGLHFTQRLLNKIIDAGVSFAKVTLHIGIGTIQPVKSETLDEHPMHSEKGSIGEKSVQQILQTKSEGGRVIAVGTTTLRVLETIAKEGKLQAWSGETNLFIRPPFDFKVADGLLTNFHLPRSTLLVLARTFGGDKLMKEAYDAAIEEEYRFYSYGDATLIT
jgi:S-adenosylmethionine:tRNA ribosyltransferase-isomerase